MLKVRLGRARQQARPALGSRGGRVLGEDRGVFPRTMTHGDTFMFAGKVLRFEGISENEALCSNAPPGTDAEDPLLWRRQVPALDLSRRTGPHHAG
jgi:ATP-dependent Lhr-like helicase